MKKHRSPGRRGQSLLEFALMIPILLLVVTVVLDLSRAVFYYSTLVNAAREGTRYAIVADDASWGAYKNEIRDTVRHYAIGMNPNDVNVAVAEVADNTISVSVSYEFTPVTPFLAALLGASDGLLLETQSTMVQER